jgi:hypothetical protein
MGASQVPAIGGSLKNWELISSVSTGGASTLSFSSISGFQSLKVLWSDTGFVTLSNARINSDTGTNYTYVGQTPSTSVGTDTFTTTAIPSASYDTFDWEISNCNNANLKTYTLDAYTPTGPSLRLSGNYLASAAITGLSFQWGAGISTTVRLYGVRA